MSHFFPCYPKTLYVQTWPIIWFDDISNLSDSIINECELDCRMRRWNGKLRKETVIHRLMIKFHINLI
ncbi:hypothetical protein LINPERHAP2_LOCUS35852 [Linum perenne]